MVMGYFLLARSQTRAVTFIRFLDPWIHFVVKGLIYEERPQQTRLDVRPIASFNNLFKRCYPGLWKASTGSQKLPRSLCPYRKRL